MHRRRKVNSAVKESKPSIHELSAHAYDPLPHDHTKQTYPPQFIEHFSKMRGLCVCERERVGVRECVCERESV